MKEVCVVGVVVVLLNNVVLVIYCVFVLLSVLVIPLIVMFNIVIYIITNLPELSEICLTSAHIIL